MAISGHVRTPILGGRSSTAPPVRGVLKTGPRRLFQVLMVLLVLGLSVVGLTPITPKADAALYNLFPADVDGFPKGQFRADEALFVTLTSDFQGGVVCVVDASVTDPAAANCLSPRWGEANRYVGIGTLLGVPFEKPLLRPGSWRLLATDTTGKNGNELSEEFEVVSCTPTCDTSVATSQLQPWKTRAALQVSTEEQEKRALAVDIATRTYKIASAAYTGFSFGLSGALLGGAWAAANFDFVVPSTEDLAKALYKQLSKTNADMWADIKNDPPDPNFGSVAAPEFLTLASTGDVLIDDHLDALMRVGAYGKASRIANERYQGAVAAGDHDAAAIQAEAAANLTYDLLGQLRRVQVLQPQVAALGWANEAIAVAPDGQDPVTFWADLANSLPSLDASDLPPADRQFLMDHGMSAQEIEDAIALWADPDWVALMQAVDPTETFADTLDADTALLGDTIEAYDAFGRWMSLNAADEQAQVVANQPPEAFSTTVGVVADVAWPINLPAYDPDGDPLTFAVTSGPTHGTLTGTAPNLTYTPDAGYLGTDAFTFTASDAVSTSNEATITLNVVFNNPPYAYDGTVDVVPGVAKSFPIYGGDPDYISAVFTVGDQPDHGSLTCTPAGSCTYTADASYVDTDSFTFTVSDGVKTSPPATITIVPTAATAVDDALTVQGSQVIDVAFNDSPVGAAVVDVTSPDHGTVRCTPYGVCLYVADAGYEGPDRFEYTLKVGTNESTATVAVTVEAAPPAAGARPTAGDDVLRTAAGTAGTVDVLANDTGDGTLTVTPSDGEHGTVACTEAGRCTYTPTDTAFVGFDVFTYTLSNGIEVDTGLVRVRVGDTPAPLSVAGVPVGGGAAAVPGGAATWVTSAANDGPVETALARSRPITATPSGPHAYVAGSARAADGWNLSVDGDEVTATAGSDALIGNQVTSVLPRPLPPISQGTGGDGHVPILVGSKVFAFFHHQDPTGVACVDRATGAVCPGYPKIVPVGTYSNPGPGAVVGTQIWVHMDARNFRTSGLFCWDAATDQTCGLITNQPGTESWDGTAPLNVAGKLWFATGAGRLRCVDPATSAPCADAPIDTGITFTYDNGDIVNHGTKVYVSDFTTVHCLDVGTGARCAGWPEGGRNLPGNLIHSHDGTSGAIDGVCGVGGKMTCVRDDDPAAVVITDVGWAFTDLTFSSSVEAEAGTRTFWASNFASGLGCFDWSTMALCVGPTVDATGGYGFSSQDTEGVYLPSAYGVVWDGSCAVAVGDSGKLFTMDFDGNSPCVSLDSGAAPQKIDLRRQRFDQEVGGATWDRVRVLGTDLAPGANFASFLVMVRDATTGEVLASQEMVDTDGVLDLSGIDPELHPSLTLGANSRSLAGADAWSDGRAPKVQLLWNADAAPLAFRTVAAACPPGDAPVLAVTSSSGDSSDRGALPLQAAPPSCNPTTTTTSTTMPTGSTTTSTPGSTTTSTPGSTTTSAPGSTSTSTSPDPTSTTSSGQQGAQVDRGTDASATATSNPPSTGSGAPVATTLARTGSDSGVMALLGAIAMVLGAASLRASRRRRITT